MANNNRGEILKAAGFIMVLIFIFLPVMLQIFVVFAAVIYFIFDIIRLKQNGNPKYNIVIDLILILAGALMITDMLIRVKFKGINIYQNYILGIIMILAIVVTGPLPLISRYKQDGWKSVKSGAWSAAFWAIVYISALYKLFNK